MKMNKRAGLIAAIAVVSTLGFIAFNKSENPSQQVQSKAEDSAPQRNVAVASPAVEVGVAADIPVTKVKALPQPEMVKKFKLIQAKVFKTKDELTSVKNMISDTRFLLQLRDYLTDLPSQKTEEFAANQNAVIDLLIEALKGGDRLSAEQAILDVIKDPQVEDEKIDQSSRQILAGVKAEFFIKAVL